jgi:hypothetical protein
MSNNRMPPGVRIVLIRPCSSHSLRAALWDTKDIWCLWYLV